MRKSTIKYIEGIIEDIDSYDKWINKREQEILYPYSEADTNIGGSSGGLDPNKLERVATKLISDKELCRLKEEKEAYNKAYRESREETQVIIQLWYHTKPRSKNWDGVSVEVHCSRTTCINLRNDFVNRIGKELGYF